MRACPALSGGILQWRTGQKSRAGHRKCTTAESPPGHLHDLGQIIIASISRTRADILEAMQGKRTPRRGKVMGLSHMTRRLAGQEELPEHLPPTLRFHIIRTWYANPCCQSGMPGRRRGPCCVLGEFHLAGAVVALRRGSASRLGARAPVDLGATRTLDGESPGGKNMAIAFDSER
jgi:hypothetical protein